MAIALYSTLWLLMNRAAKTQKTSLQMQCLVIAAFLEVFLLVSASSAQTTFQNPQPIQIKRLPVGYGGQALSTEEPFVSRDGNFLFFNSHKLEGHKDLHYAELVNNKWVYRSEIGPHVNTKKEVEGNPSMDSFNRFYYVNSGVKHMVSVGTFQPKTGTLAKVEELTALPEKHVRLFAQKVSGNMGIEVSTDGGFAFFSRATWDLNGISLGQIVASDLLMLFKRDGSFIYDESLSRRLLKNINTKNMEYAASISADGRELFFTRLYPKDISKSPRSRIMRSIRSSTNEPFGTPETILAIGTSDFVEGPAISANGRELYYHKLEEGKFRLYKVSR